MLIKIIIIIIGTIKVRIRRGRKFKDEEKIKNIKENQIKDINKNYLCENEIYEQVDPKKDPDLLQLTKDKKEFFERLDCRFGSPFELADETHFRTYKEARILTRGDRDIIIKRLTEEVSVIHTTVYFTIYIFRYYYLCLIIIL